jgi:hypothetical protein
LADDAGDGADGLQASVERVEWLGDVTLVHCRLAGRDAANAGVDTISVKTTLADDATLPHGTASAPARAAARPDAVRRAGTRAGGVKARR